MTAYLTDSASQLQNSARSAGRTIQEQRLAGTPSGFPRNLPDRMVRDADEFLATLGQALAHLEPLGMQARVRWDQLLRMVLHWALFRRPEQEVEKVRKAALDSHSNVELKREVEAMSQLIEKTREEALIERFLKEGEARGEARGEMRALQAILRTQLQQRFGPLPDEVLQRIATADVERLNSALAAVLTLGSLNDLAL